MTNCPNCGAPLKNNRCEYCGTNITPRRKHRTPYERKIELRKIENEYLKQEILNVLKERGCMMTAKQIANNMYSDITPQRVASLLKSLENEKKIKFSY